MYEERHKGNSCKLLHLLTEAKMRGKRGEELLVASTVHRQPSSKTALYLPAAHHAVEAGQARRELLLAAIDQPVQPRTETYRSGQSTRDRPR